MKLFFCKVSNNSINRGSLGSRNFEIQLQVFSLCAMSQDAASVLVELVKCVGAGEVKGAGPHISAFDSVQFSRSISENAL